MPGPPSVRVHPRVKDVGVGRVGRDVTAGRLRIYIEDLLPALPAVGGLEDPTLLVRPPFASESAGIDEIRILRIDHDAGDLVRVGQSDLRPVLAGVDRLVHPVADRGVVARILLARADVDDVRIARRYRNRADRADVLLVEDRLEGRPAVDRP